jgi:hypothetical protein
MTDHRIIHRFIPAAAKHGSKTACGIKLVCGPLREDGAATTEAITDDGGFVAVSMKGKPFDCRRCRSVLEQLHKKETA